MTAKTRSPLARPPLVLVVWEDVTELDTTAWVQETDHNYQNDGAIVTSVGFLLHDSKAGIVLTSAWCKDGLVARREQIPRGMIRTITRLKG